MTLTEAFELYRLEYIEYNNQSKKTEEAHNTCLSLLLQHFGDIQMDSLTPQQIRFWKRELGRTRSQNTVRGYVIKLRVVLAWLRTEGYSVAPVERIEVPKKKKAPVSFLAPEEVQGLIEASGNGRVRINQIRNKAFLSLIYSSGIRLSECIGLDRSHVRTDVFSVNSKGGDPRPCFIDERSRKYLNEYLKLRTEGYDIYWINRGGKVSKRIRKHYEPDNEAALFLNHETGRRMTAADGQEIMKNARRNAGITTRATIHTLRHSFATDLLRSNCNIRHVQAMLGHKSLETTQVYTHVVDFDLMQAHKAHHTI